MPQLQQIDTFLSQIFWLVVCFLVLFLFLRAVALPRVTEVLDARRRKIEGDLEKATALKAEAEKALAQYQAAMAQGREQAQALLRKVGDEAQARATAAQGALGKKLAQEIKGAEERIEAARKTALANVQRVSAELAQAATQRLIGVSVDAAAAEAAVGAVSQERGA
ncbi:MAG: F0F1 ATP synthase subunit B' [Rhodospirillaceae bacterium]|nr:F0F1 ATP synthase subunit B' [Rhodospirillaceae bacterium]